MEYPFQNSPCPCLKRVLGEVRNLEQAQEIRLTDGMPDIGRVLCGWGQVLQRSKEWNGDTVTLSAGVMVWVLYAPEDGSEVRCVEGWIPFTMNWDLPESVPEGKLLISCLTRFVDARNVSARKIMVRAGIGAMAEAYTPFEAMVYTPQEDPPKVELKKAEYPLTIPVEAGEKQFSLEESLDLPATVPEMEKLILYTLDSEVGEHRVMGDKLVFKGSARLHILYKGPEGKLHSWDFTLPFSQFADLEQSCSPEGEAFLFCAVTGLELEQTDGNSLNLKASLTGQYLIRDRKLLELTEDAYCPGRELQTDMQHLEISNVLECRRENISAELSIPGDGSLSADVAFFPDFPRQKRMEGQILYELSGTFQVLYYGPGGELQAAVSRWEGSHSLAAGENARVSAMPLMSQEPQILMGGGDMKIRTEFPLQFTAEAGEGIPMVTGLTLGEEITPAEDRPSLILKRAGDQSLWDLAKASGSTVGAIQNANHLEGEPEPGQMLLIPVF